MPASGFGHHTPMQAHVLAPPHSHTQLQALEPVQAMDPFMVYCPALAPQHHPDALVPEARVSTPARGYDDAMRSGLRRDWPGTKPPERTATSDRPAARSRDTVLTSSPPGRGAWRASELFSHHVGQNVLVEAQIRHHAA